MYNWTKKPGCITFAAVGVLLSPAFGSACLNQDGCSELQLQLRCATLVPCYVMLRWVVLCCDCALCDAVQ